MASTSYHSVKLTAGGVQNEAKVASAITPGMLGELDSSLNLQPHSTSGGNVAPIIICLMSELEGEDIDDAYAANDRAQYLIPYPGQQVVLRIADGQNVAANDLLMSNGDGYMRVATDQVDSSADVTTIYPRRLVARALEAMDMSSSSGGDGTGKCKCVIV